jgi:hypothetical protein
MCSKNLQVEPNCGSWASLLEEQALETCNEALKTYRS